MGSKEQKAAMTDVGYYLACDLGHPNVVTFEMVAYNMKCSVSLVKTYMTNLENLRTEILKVARQKGNLEMIGQTRTLKTMERRTKPK